MPITTSAYVGPAFSKTINADNSITFSLEASLNGDNVIDFQVTVQPGDNQQTILNNIGTTLRARATALGYTIPTNFIVVEDAYLRA